MVNFNNDVTIGTPAVDIERVSILQRRAELIDSIGEYKRKRFAGGKIPTYSIQARLFELWLELQAAIQRWFKGDELQEIKDICEGIKEPTEESLLKTFYKINSKLDQIRLTKIDTQKYYDPSSTEAENKEKGY